MTEANDVMARLEVVRSDIDGLGVDPDDLEIVAVTKTRSVATVAAARSAGLDAIGENYAQELAAKATAPGLADDPGLRWHMLGRLQSNKIRLLVPHVSLWQTVDRPKLGAEIAKRSPGAAVLVQVNISGEPQKGGCEPGDVTALVDDLRARDLDVRGLMGVASAGDRARAGREFAALRRFVDDLDLSVCSMGMSADYREAVLEGSTMLRLGTRLVGPRVLR